MRLLGDFTPRGRKKRAQRKQLMKAAGVVTLVSAASAIGLRRYSK